MCSPISDGTAAAVVCNRSALKRLGIDERRAVRVLASIVHSGADREPDEVEKHVTALASKRAYEIAGVGPADVSLAEVHDATAMGEIIQLENLGFCAFGDGGAISEHGETEIGGRIPVNPSGGLESKGHPIGATGLGRSTSWSSSCGATPVNVRSTARASRWPRTAAVFTASRKPSPVSPSWPADGGARRMGPPRLARRAPMCAQRRALPDFQLMSRSFVDCQRMSCRPALGLQNEFEISTTRVG